MDSPTGSATVAEAGREPPSAPAQPTRRANPYVGPRPFRPGERLYGRDREIQELLDLLIAERVVLLHSPSGAGKSSLIQAGLIPRLKDEGFHVLPVARVSLEPSPAVLKGRVAANGAFNRYVFSLLLSMEEALPAEQRTPLDKLAGLDLATYLSQRPRKEDDPDSEVLILDQFEEILTIDPANREAKAAFFSQLGAALRDRKRWALIAMRADYVAALDPYLRPVPTRLDNRFPLELLGPDASRQAIQLPARMRGVLFLESAARKLVDDLRRMRVQRLDGTMEEQPGPHVEPVQLQVVCYRLWENLAPDDREITEDDLAAVGDVDTALAEYYAGRVAAAAEATKVRERAIREWVDGQLITDQGTRGQVLMGAGKSEGLDNRVVSFLESAHLLRSEKRGGATWFELAHDRLLQPVRANNTAWFQSNLSELQRLAAVWDKQDRPEAMVLRGEALARAEEWAAAHPDEMTQVEQDFLEASRRVQVLIRQARRRNRIIAGLAVGATIAAIAAFGFWAQASVAQRQAEVAAEDAERSAATAEAASTEAINQKLLADAASLLAFQQKATAEAASLEAERERQHSAEQAEVNFERELAAAALNSLEIDPERGVLLALQGAAVARSLNQPPLSQAENALHRALSALRIERTVFGQAIPAVGFSPDGHMRVVALLDDAMKVWDVTTWQDLQNVGEVAFAAFSPDGSRLAALDEDGLITVWDTATEARLLTLEVEPPAIGVPMQLVFSPDGSRLALAGVDNIVQIWDVTTGVQWPSLDLRQRERIQAMAFSPDNARLAIATLSDMGMWDVVSGQELYTLFAQDGVFLGLDFSPDGRYLAIGSSDRTAQFYTSEGEGLFALPGHTDYVSDVAFSPDGRWLATASYDRAVKLWRLEYDPAGRLQSGQEVLSLRGHTGWVTSVEFSPDGIQLATYGEDITARLWNIAATYEVFTLDAHGRIYSAAFSPDGTRLVTAGADQTANVWDAATAQWLFTLEGHTGPVEFAVFSPDGTRIATAGRDGKAHIWDAASGRDLRTLVGHEGEVYGIAFSPDGTR
ncbi:MAG: hypothetical protein ACRDH2_00640, partial [Anaerolineales bacterium]